MHELSLMQGILDSIGPVARENGADRITNITLTIGEMTEVVEEAMQFAFDALTQDEPFFDDAQLTMNFVSPKSKCLDCGTEFTHDRYHLRCPNCDSGATIITEGKELHIASIEVDIP